MAITDTLVSLEKAVEDAEKKLSALNQTEKTLEVAQKSYSEALALVEKLKSELTSKIGNIFPDPRVRASK